MDLIITLLYLVIQWTWNNLTSLFGLIISLFIVGLAIKSFQVEKEIYSKNKKYEEQLYKLQHPTLSELIKRGLDSYNKNHDILKSEEFLQQDETTKKKVFRLLKKVDLFENKYQTLLIRYKHDNNKKFFVTKDWYDYNEAMYDQIRHEYSIWWAPLYADIETMSRLYKDLDLNKIKTSEIEKRFSKLLNK